MNPDDLYLLLKHILVWVPINNPIRAEIVDLMRQCLPPKAPDIEVVQNEGEK